MYVVLVGHLGDAAEKASGSGKDYYSMSFVDFSAQAQRGQKCDWTCVAKMPTKLLRISGALWTAATEMLIPGLKARRLVSEICMHCEPGSSRDRHLSQMLEVLLRRGLNKLNKY